MLLPRFELHRPETAAEAVALASRLGDDSDYVAGGTDLLQNYKNRLNPKGHLISLARVRELSELTPTRLGALVRLCDLEESPMARERLRVVAEAAAKVASPLVRQTATLGGNLLVETRCYYFNQSHFWRASKGYCMKAEGDVCLVVPQKEKCYAAFSGDLAPALMVLGASVRLLGPAGERTVPLTAFYAGDGIKRHVRLPGELILGVEIPEAARDLRGGYRKLRLRDSFDYPEMGLAVALRMDGDRLASLRVAASAVDTVPIEFDELTAGLAGRPLTAELLEVLAETLMRRVKPVKNTALSPNYRRRMVGVFLKRLVSELAREG